MKGVAKFFPAGEAAVQALIAGNDMLCLPEDVPAAIEAIKAAIKKKRLKQNDIDDKVQKVLAAKYDLGLSQAQVVDTTNLLEDLNAKTEDLKKQVARNTVTVLRNDANLFPFRLGQRIAYVGFGSETVNTFGKRLAHDFHADTFALSYKADTAMVASVLQQINSKGYDAIIVGVHDYSYRPANNYNISKNVLDLWSALPADKTITFLFGNVYAAKNFCDAKTLVAIHQDDEAFQQTAADFLRGSLSSIGRLPVSVCTFPYGTSIVLNNRVSTGSSVAWLGIDSIMNDAMAKKAFPGAVVIAVQNGEIKYHKAFGKYEYADDAKPITLESIYDLASVTKVSATTVAVMKLYEQGKLDLNKTLGDYLPWTQGSNKAGLLIKDVLLHQAGLSPFIPFYKETIDTNTGMPSSVLYKSEMDTLYTIPVARNLYLRKDWTDTLHKRIVQSPLTAHGKYVYSDNDFILLGSIVETLTGMPLDQYVQKTFYSPMGMATTGFQPWKRFGVERVVPTEKENYFRRQLLRGYVHDEGASLFGGIAGHAGLFSNAYDLAMLYQMLLDGGVFNGERYLKPETIQLFTAYGSEISRRGLGFDKPEKDNATSKSPYPSALASLASFGHTGFTGTCVWVDPEAKLVYVFLSNRVYDSRGNNKLSTMGIRGKVQDVIYKALKSEAAVQQPATASLETH
jgi:beta-N-acetylhexosaminidase